MYNGCNNVTILWKVDKVTGEKKTTKFISINENGKALQEKAFS